MSVAISAKCYAYIGAAWVELDEVAPGRVTRGMSNNDPETRIADIGEMTCQLNNNSGVYTPGVTAGWKKGIPFKLEITYEGEIYIAFRGAISDIELESKPGDKLIRITALDWLDYASKYPIVNPDLLENVKADTAISTIVAAMPIQPQAQSLDTGKTIYPTVFDTVRGNTKAYAEISKIVNSEIGAGYLIADKVNGETLVFESVDFRNGTRQIKKIPIAASVSGFLLKEDGGFLLKEDGGNIIIDQTDDVIVDNIMIGIDVKYGENILNRFVGSAYPKREDEYPVKIYETEKEIYLGAASGPKTFRVFWTDPTGKRKINARPPTRTTNTKSIVHFNLQNGLVFEDELGKEWTASEYDTFVSNRVRFGGGAAYLDGTNSYMTTPHSPDWEFGSGNFTIEWWEWRFNSTSGALSFSRDGTDAVPAWRLGQSDGVNLAVYMSSDGVNNDIANSRTLGPITLDTWNHFAVSRSGSNFYTFKNGTLVDTWSSAASLFSTSAPLYIGKNVATYLTACIDDVRITKGECLYSASFSVPTVEFSVEGTFYSLWTERNSLGTDITSGLVASANYGTEGATYTVENQSTTSGYLTIKTFGYGIYSDSAIENTVEDTDSINSYGYQNVGLQQPYQQDLSAVELEGAKVIELEKQPRTVLNSIKMVAYSSSFNMMCFLNVNIGDLVRIKNTKHGIDAMCYVQGIEYQINGGLIFYKWILKQAWTFELGLSQMAVEFRGGVTTDAVNFGYIPLMSDDQITRRGISAWIYMHTNPTASGVYCICSPLSDSGGQQVVIQYDTGAANNYLATYTNRFSTTAGGWRSGFGAITLNTWVHVFVSLELTSTSSNPTMYIGGVAQTVTETITPTGTTRSEVGARMIVGNEKTSTHDFDRSFDGKIKDLRVYNMDNIAVTDGDLAYGLALEGAGGAGYYDGMVFQAFTIRTSDLTAYTDLTMTTEKILDGYNGVVGTANGSPIVRLP
jgi:hypothetical protein